MTNQLAVLSELPDDFYDFRVSNILQVFPTPTLIHLKGKKGQPLFISILLHGNEFSGLKTMQALLKKYADDLPRPVYLFIGNVLAAASGLRVIPCQTDFNRCWPGTDIEKNDATKMMQQVVNIVTEKPLFAAIDLHNNSGFNPHYACITDVTQDNYHIAAMFNHIGMVFRSPKGVSTMAFDGICPAATLERDGRIRHVEGLRFPVGELDGAVRDRTVRLVELFEESGFKSRAIKDIRSELWLKVWGAVSINPISALSRATMVDICDFDLTRDVIVNMMREVQHVAEALGASFRHTIEKRVSGARAVGAHKTSMLQNVESGRPLELDALMLSVIQLAGMVDIKVPTVRTVYACVALLNQNLIADASQTEKLVARVAW